MDVAFADKTLYGETSSGKIKTERTTRRARGDSNKAYERKSQAARRKLKATAKNVSRIPKIDPYDIGEERFSNFEDSEEALSVWVQMLTPHQFFTRLEALGGPDPYGAEGSDWHLTFYD